MTKEEFLAFSFSSPELPILFQEWKNAINPRKRWLVPSVDRINEEGNYCIENIQWITWEANYEKELKRSGCSSSEEAVAFLPAIEEEIPDWL